MLSNINRVLNHVALCRKFPIVNCWHWYQLVKPWYLGWINSIECPARECQTLRPNLQSTIFTDYGKRIHRGNYVMSVTSKDPMPEDCEFINLVNNFTSTSNHSHSYNFKTHLFPTYFPLHKISDSDSDSNIWFTNTIKYSTNNICRYIIPYTIILQVYVFFCNSSC